jgi:Xaa-Pro dipeptidase
VDKGKLHRDMVELRVHKTRAEVAVLRYAAQLSADAHRAVLRACRPGMMEYQLEATFLHHAYFHGGARQSGYTPICASGPNAAVLHYGHAGAPNSRRIADGDLCLVDCGAEYHGYDGDLTSTFPANGRFTSDQRDVYETVLAALRGVEAAMRPGVLWPDMHRLAYRIIAEQLLARGFLAPGASIDDILAAHVVALFMPHGLGHLLGLDTHDVGGYPARSGVTRPTDPGIRRLRTARTLEPGMVITVEPGVYFNPFLLEPALTDPAVARFFVPDKIRSFLSFGGVRLEDNVLITDSGIEILNPNLPRTCEEIEAAMAH